MWEGAVWIPCGGGLRRIDWNSLSLRLRGMRVTGKDCLSSIKALSREVTGFEALGGGGHGEGSVMILGNLIDTGEGSNSYKQIR